MNRRIEYTLRIFFNFFRFTILKLIYGKRINNSWKTLVSSKADIYLTNKGYINLGKMCNIEKNTQIRATGGEVFIGNNVYINRNCNIVSHKKISIEDNVTIGPNVCIFDHDHNYKKKKTGNDYVSKDVVIGTGTWIGSNCIITKGVIIGSNCVIATGTIVTKNVPNNMIIRTKCEYVMKNIED